jgi:hypothetical protein
LPTTMPAAGAGAAGARVAVRLLLIRLL